MVTAASPVLAPLRFAPERELIEDLFARFGLDALIDHFVGEGHVAEMYDFILGSQLRLTPVLSPRLTGLLGEARAVLGFTAPVDLFVGPDAGINAGAIHSVTSERPHVLSLSSALVERMDDDELRFVLGHELGHLAFDHYRARLAGPAFGDDDDGTSRMPPLLARRLESWDRLAELSADRAGFRVIDGRLDVAVRVFFKLQSGLGPEHLRFDVGAFLDQLERLEALERRELLSVFSHPATPIRVRALQLFAPVPAGGDLAAVDAEVLRLARLMDFEATRPLDVQARDFLLAGGVLAAMADGEEVTHEEWETLVQLLLPLCADPEAELTRITTADEADEILTRSATWLRDNAGEERFDLLRNLAHVVCVDGRLLGNEQRFVHQVADALAIPERAADQILYDVLAGYLQSQAMRRAAVPLLGGRRAPRPPAPLPAPPTAGPAKASGDDP
ncbi:MAG: M48 family metalloprotease [Kofleriaceae bacterium]|nr:M48 family metalloprotease [Myxococcales bacterium]MCB9560515.1 M48 family metalloprotease [Kofleriaceae bacterium]